MRREIWISLALLGALLIGVMLGEAGVGSGLVNAAKVQLTGRLPLQEWESMYPSSFSLGKYWYYNPSAASEEREAWISHPVGRDGEGVAAKALELELRFIAITMEEDSQLTVIVSYTDGGSRRADIPSRVLGALMLQSGDIGKWTVSLDPNRPVDHVHLWGSRIPALMWIAIERAELILR